MSFSSESGSLNSHATFCYFLAVAMVVLLKNKGLCKSHAPQPFLPLKPILHNQASGPLFTAYFYVRLNPSPLLAFGVDVVKAIA